MNKKIDTCNNYYLEDLISVIVPVYKVEKYIDRCVKSLLCQDYENVEIILIDDGSPDNCVEIINEYSRKDPRVRVYHQENCGLSAARNKGIELAHGEYLFFLDSDDWIDKNCFSVLMEKIGDADMAVCSSRYLDDKKTQRENKCDGVYTGIEVLSEILQQRWWHWIYAWGKLFRHELWDGEEFPLAKLNEDMFIIPTIYSKCKKIVFTSDTFCYYYQRDDSIVHQETEYMRLCKFEAYVNTLDLYIKLGIDNPTAYDKIIARLFFRIDQLHCEEAEVERAARKINRRFIKTYNKLEDHLRSDRFREELKYAKYSPTLFWKKQRQKRNPTTEPTAK